MQLHCFIVNIKSKPAPKKHNLIYFICTLRFKSVCFIVSERSLFCSTKLHLFDQKYSKNVKYYYSLKGGTMLFHAFRVVYTVKELDSHAKHGQSKKK